MLVFASLEAEFTKHGRGLAGANKIKETQSDISMLEHLRDNVLSDAIICNAIERPNEPVPDGNWIAAREEWI